MDKEVSKTNTHKERKKIKPRLLILETTNKQNETSYKEQGGPKGPEPTRYGDWEKAGRCTDF